MRPLATLAGPRWTAAIEDFGGRMEVTFCRFGDVRPLYKIYLPHLFKRADLDRCCFEAREYLRNL